MRWCLTVAGRRGLSYHVLMRAAWPYPAECNVVRFKPQGARHAHAHADADADAGVDGIGEGSMLSNLAEQSRAANEAARQAAESVKLIAAALGPAMEPNKGANLETEQVNFNLDNHCVVCKGHAFDLGPRFPVCFTLRGSGWNRTCFTLCGSGWIRTCFTLRGSGQGQVEHALHVTQARALLHHCSVVHCQTLDRLRTSRPRGSSCT